MVSQGTRQGVVCRVYRNAGAISESEAQAESTSKTELTYSNVAKHDRHNYSSGMRVRLGFAIAIAIEPEVLLLDEVLAVDDMSFRNKCDNRIGPLQKIAATVLVTSLRVEENRRR